ncbi:hypothetical protein [Bacillus velezensis]|uniref:hypothetical protein n=1 Tax=Bacillus velezensis TaxID=492670 RepID=UPI002E0D293C
MNDEIKSLNLIDKSIDKLEQACVLITEMLYHQNTDTAQFCMQMLDALKPIISELRTANSNISKEPSLKETNLLNKKINDLFKDIESKMESLAANKNRA